MNALRPRWTAHALSLGSGALGALVLGTLALGASAPRALGEETQAPSGATRYAAVTRDRAVTFPADYGSHPLFRTEWWYLTGWLRTQEGEDLGFQVTFFRSRPDIAADNPSAFAPRQLIIVHAAISDTKRGRLWQDQRVRRAGLGLADAEPGDTHVWADDWELRRAGGLYHADVVADEFSLHLYFAPTQSPMLNGQSGLSRKGPAAQAASYYYSIPHLHVSGVIARGGKADPVDGEAWLDHEWSSEYLDPEAIGWDWIGINLNDGAALMAFRIRAAHGEVLWAGGSLQTADGRVQALEPADVTFSPLHRWISPRTAIAYPVEWHVHAGAQELDLLPLLNDQENDTRLSSGTIYWEGAVSAYAAHRLVGRGYLELTGYGERLRLR